MRIHRWLIKTRFHNKCKHQHMYLLSFLRLSTIKGHSNPWSVFSCVYYPSIFLFLFWNYFLLLSVGFKADQQSWALGQQLWIDLFILAANSRNVPVTAGLDTKMSWGNYTEAIHTSPTANTNIPGQKLWNKAPDTDVSAANKTLHRVYKIKQFFLACLPSDRM